MFQQPKTALVMSLMTLTLAGVSNMPSVAASSAHRQVPPDSYLQDRVYTVNQLIQQVQNNPTVRQRFARHFQIPQDRVVSYMRANLVESYVPVTRRYTVYCMSPSGRIFAVKQTFHKGTKVFALRNGDPVLKWLCGNPLSKYLPAVQTKTIVKKPKTKVAGAIETLVTPAENVDVLVPNEAVAPTYVPVVPINFGSAPAALFTGGGSGGFSPLFLLPAALLFSHSGGGGGSTPNTPPIIPPIIPPVGPPVPEPGGATLMLAALPVLAVVVARRKAGGTSRPPQSS